MRLLCSLLVASRIAQAADCVPVKAAPEALMAQAQTAIDAGRFAEAAKRYREVTCLDANNATAYYALGVVEAAARNYVAAGVALKKADALRPDIPRALAMLVNVQLAAADTDGALGSLRAAGRRFPANGALHAELSRLLADRRLYDLALAESLRWERSGEADPDAKLALAVLENRTGAHVDAIRHATSLENDASLAARTRASAASVAGLSYDSLSRRDDAIRRFQAAIELDAASETPYLALASIYEKAGDSAAAVDILERTAAKARLLPLGANLLKLNRHAAAVDPLSEAIRDRPDAFEAYERLAEAYRGSAQPDRQIQTLRRLLELKPDYPMIHVLLAEALLDSGAQDEQALAELTLAGKADPADPDVHYLRARTLLARRQFEAAVDAALHAIELRPTEARFYYPLGRAYAGLGKTELSREALGRMEYLRKLAAAP